MEHLFHPFQKGMQKQRMQKSTQDKKRNTKKINAFTQIILWVKLHWRAIAAGFCAVAIFGLSYSMVYFKDIFTPEQLFPGPQISGTDDNDYEQLLSQADLEFLKNRVTFLVLGIDSDPSRETTASGFRTDTIMVCTINFDTNKVDLISIPRDSYIHLLNGAKSRVNTAFTYGGGLNGGGFEATMQTISKLMGGIPIDYYVAVDMAGLYYIADAVAPIPVTITRDYDHCIVRGLDDAASTNPNCGTQHELGVQNLDALHFLSYVRQRYGDSDIKRAGRQQQALIELVQHMRSANLITTAPAFYTTYKDYIYTNFDLRQIASLALYALDLDFSNDITTHIAPGDFLNLKNAEGNLVSYWGLDMSAWKDLIKEVFGINVSVDTSMDVALLKKEAEEMQAAYDASVSSANQAIESGNAVLQQYGNKMTEDQKNELSNAIQECQSYLKDGTTTELTLAANTLNDVINKIKNQIDSGGSSINAAQSVYDDAVSKFSKYKSVMTQEEITQCQTAIEALQSAISSKDTAKIQAAQEQVEALSTIFADCAIREPAASPSPSPSTSPQPSPSPTGNESESEQDSIIEQ